MKQHLQALLPIHALRESRALRHCHEQQAAHELALAVEASATAERARLQRESDEALGSAVGSAVAGAVASGTLRAGDAQWALHRSAELKQRADAVDSTLPELASHTRRAADAEQQARAAHAARVRAHRKVCEAARRVSAREAQADAATVEQRMDDDFAPRWFADRSARRR